MKEEHVKKVKEELDTVSSSFCLAKWKQVTVHLQNGHTHSCHHPGTHVIPLSEIKHNPSALHNTMFKKAQRKLMLEGARPPECEYCWRIEDSGGTSDRILKSADPVWGYPYFQEVVSQPWDANIDPSYFEVSFGNVCNFKCSYCSPNISSQWMEEIERHGPYPTSMNFNNLEWLKQKQLTPIPNNQDNPYVDAFWKWFPEMYQSLKHFRITGGEPLLNKNTFKVLDYIIENPNSELEFSINTNLNIPIELFNKFIEKIRIILDEKKIKKFILYTSAEAHGTQAEYIRFGMNYDEWIENLHRVFTEVPGIHVSIMSTYNLLSLDSYTDFLNDVLMFKRKYGNRDYNPLSIDIPYLRNPEHQVVFLMEPEYLDNIKEQITFIAMNLEYGGWHETAHRGFFGHDVDKLKRIYYLAKAYISDPANTEKIMRGRKDFVIFVDEHDKRRGTNFAETFPNLMPMYNKWKSYN